MTKQIFVLITSVLIFTFIPMEGYLSAQTVPQYYNSNIGSSNNTIPLNSATANKMQWLYGPGVFKTAGSTGTIAPPGLISDVFFRLGNITSASPYNNFTIKMSQNVGTITSWTNPLFITGMDTAFYAPLYALVNPQSNQWYHITLQNLIPYDPLFSLVVEICVSSGTGNNLLEPLMSASIHQNRYGLYNAVSGTTSPKVIDFGINISQGTTDAGLESFVNLSDTICDGMVPITVKLKNHGQSVLNSVDIHWKVNNLAQTPYNWTGSITPGNTTNVTIGAYPFLNAINYQIIAYSNNPNSITDTINHNDTILKPEIIIKPSPGLTLLDTLKTICQGDSVAIDVTLTGSPPWNLVINDGSTTIPVTNITQSQFSYMFTPTTTQTYTLTDINDATGCTNNNIYNFTVTVQQAPSATISPTGSTAACQGDSVTLMASIGLGFTYQWYLDGTPLPFDTNYVIHAKQGGGYTVKVTSPIGCSNVSTPLQVTIHPLPLVDLGNDTVLYPNQNIILDAGAGFNSYTWSTGESTQTITIDSAGTGIGIKTVWVRVTDNYNCPGTDTININFTQHPGISEAGAGSSIQIIPNPSDGMFSLMLKGTPAGEYLVEVFSYDGRLVYRSLFMINSGNESVKLNIQHFADGVYRIKVTGNGRIENGNIVIRK